MVIKNLLRSRKFWLMIVGIVQTIVLEYFGVSQEVWQAINTLLLILIGAIAVEDAGAKINAGKSS